MRLSTRGRSTDKFDDKAVGPRLQQVLQASQPRYRAREIHSNVPSKSPTSQRYNFGPLNAMQLQLFIKRNICSPSKNNNIAHTGYHSPSDVIGNSVQPTHPPPRNANPNDQIQSG